MNTVFVNADAMDDLLNSGILPPAVVALLVAQNHTPYTRAAAAKMVEQADDEPNTYIITVKCIAADDDYYPIRVAVAQFADH